MAPPDTTVFFFLRVQGLLFENIGNKQCHIEKKNCSVVLPGLASYGGGRQRQDHQRENGKGLLSSYFHHPSFFILLFN